MVHVHLLVYGEYVPQKELADAWRVALGVAEVPVVDVRAVDPDDPARGLRETLKYTAKGAGTPREQASRAAAIECALQGVQRISVGGALRQVSLDLDPANAGGSESDVYGRQEATCEACGQTGGWSWTGLRPRWYAAHNGDWGLLRQPTAETGRAGRRPAD